MYRDKTTAEKMTNFAVTSHVNYSNSHLYGINGYSVSKLQCWHNDAVHKVSSWRKYYHTVPKRATLAASWADDTLYNPMADLQGSAWYRFALPVVITIALKHGWTQRPEGKYPLMTPRYRLVDFDVLLPTQHLPFRTPSLYIWNVPSPLTFSRAAETRLFDDAYHNASWYFLSLYIFFQL